MMARLIEITEIPLSGHLLKMAGWEPNREIMQDQVDSVARWWSAMGIEPSEHALRAVRSLWGLRLDASKAPAPSQPETLMFDLADRHGKLRLPIEHDIIELLVEEGFAGPTTPAPIGRLISDWDVVCVMNCDGRSFAVLHESDLWCEWKNLDAMIYGIVTGVPNFTRKRGIFSWLPDEPSSLP